MTALRVLLALVLSAVFVLAARPATRALPLLAGAARVDITPGMPVALEGYLDPENRISEGVHDRLYARAVALGVGAKRVVLVSCDLGSLWAGPYFLRLIAERWGLQPDEILLCAIHTHSGPQLSLNPDYPHANNFRYTRALERTLVDVTGKALAAMSPARIAVGRGRTAVGVSRRTVLPDGRVEMLPNPQGAADDEVLVLRISRPTGPPLAVLFDYASHSRSLRRGNKLVSGDILGIAEQVVERSAGGGMIAAAFAGASGDVDPASVVDSFEAPPGETPPTVRLATLLGDEAARAAATAMTLQSPAGLRTAAARVTLPPKNAGQARWVNVIVVTIGDVAIVGLDCEASVEVGLAIKKASPFAATFVITHCNGWAGYLPTARQHAEGGYEVARSGFGPGAADVLTRETLAMLARLR